MANYVMDACALIAYLRDEPGAERVLELMDDSRHTIFMHAITLGEVYYDTQRFSDAEQARQVLSDITSFPIVVVRDLSNAMLMRAGDFKASHRISYADAFVLALAQDKQAAVVTADHHEFDPIAQQTAIAFLWLR